MKFIAWLFDPLTPNSPNRRLLHDRLHQARAASARDEHYGAVIFIDLDHFKTLMTPRVMTWVTSYC